MCDSGIENKAKGMHSDYFYSEINFHMIVAASNKKLVLKSHFIIELFLFTISLILLLYQESDYYWYYVISCLALFLFVAQCVGYLINRISIFDFIFIFIILSYFFMFGHAFLLAFGFEKYIFWELYKEFSPKLMLNSGLLILNYLELFYIGTLMGKRKHASRLYGRFGNRDDAKVSKTVYRTGKVLFFLSLPFRLYTDYTLIRDSRLTSNYFKVSMGSGIYDDIGYLCIPGIAYILSSKRLSKKKAFILVITTVVYMMVVMAVTGDRRYEVTAIIAVIICLIKSYKIRLSFPRILLAGYLGSALLNTLIIIRNIRKGRLLAISDFLSEYIVKIFFSVSTLRDTLLDTMAEFGISFFSVVQVLKNIPSHIPFQLGKGFWGSVPAILPLGSVMSQWFDSLDISHLANLREGNPVGQTIVGDFYANFGSLCIILFFLFGIFCCRFFSDNCAGNSMLSNARNCSFIYIEINLVRACFFEVFRNSIYIYFVPLFIMYTLNRRETSYKFDFKR